MTFCDIQNIGELNLEMQITKILNFKFLNLNYNLKCYEVVLTCGSF